MCHDLGKKAYICWGNWHAERTIQQIPKSGKYMGRCRKILAVYNVSSTNSWWRIEKNWFRFRSNFTTSSGIKTASFSLHRFIYFRDFDICYIPFLAWQFVLQQIRVYILYIHIHIHTWILSFSPLPNLSLHVYIYIQSIYFSCICSRHHCGQIWITISSYFPTISVGLARWVLLLLLADGTLFFKFFSQNVA